MKFNFRLLTIMVTVLFLLTSSIPVGVSAGVNDDSISMLDGSFTEVMSDTTYVDSLGRRSSSRYDEFYITTSGATELVATITPNSRARFESSDDFDLYYSTGSQVSGCSSSSCSGYDLASTKRESFGNGFEEVTVTSPADTTHYFRVQRYGGSGTEYFNFVVSVTSGGGGGDTTVPTVSISSPADGSTLSGTQTVSATASDNVGVDRVEFSVDGSLKFTDSSSPYSYSLDTTLYSDGSHSVTATAFDAAGNSASDSNSYTFDNGGSPPPIGDCGETPRVTGSMPWWNDAIDVETAHAASCYGGNSVVVILDTGLNSATYPSLFPSGSINTQYSRSYTKDYGFDNVNWNQDTTEGHGTSTTSTVLGYYVPSSWGFTNNYVQGVAPNSEVVMFRVVYWIGAGVTATQMLNNWAQAINDAVALHTSGAFGSKGMIISMSLGYTSTNTNLNNAIANAENNGVVVSTSAGNDGPSAGTTGYPANHVDAVSVAAAGWSGYTGSYGVSGIVGDIPENDFSGLTIADFSSRGKVEITAIGWNLVLPSQDGSYYYISGTSFSCPQTSGVFALMFSMYGSSVTVSFLLSTMQAGAYSMSPSTTWGSGFVQADGALGL